MMALQAKQIGPLIDRIASARTPEAYRNARAALFALDASRPQDADALIQELAGRHSAEATLALEEFLLSQLGDGDTLARYAQDAHQPSLIRASMTGLLGRLALVSPSRRTWVRDLLERLANDADLRVSGMARDALSDLDE